MTNKELYRSKLINVQQCLDLIKSGDKLSCGIYAQEPVPVLRQLHTIADRVENVEIWMGREMEIYPFSTDPSLPGKIDFRSVFYGATGRAAHKLGLCTVMPGNLHDLVERKNLVNRSNIYIGCATPMDERGNFCMPLSLQWEKEVLETADIVVLLVNPRLPRTYGDNLVPIDAVDYIIELEMPLAVLDNPVPTKEERVIGQYIASMVRDGDCIQLGIGGTSAAVANELAGKKYLGAHTEMLTTSMMHLMKSGVLDCSRKNLNPGKVVCAFAYGTEELYKFVENNPMVEFRSATYINDPFVIAQNNNMVSINTAIEVDLTGQVNSESINGLQFSGTGGATDFAFGASHSKGGYNIIAIPSTTRDGRISKIKAQLPKGSIVSVSRNLVDYVVTEYGIAPMRGRTVRQRIENLIAVAHPDFRAELRQEAKELMIW